MRIFLVEEQSNFGLTLKFEGFVFLLRLFFFNISLSQTLFCL